jgi:hypothetical protein
MASTYCGPQIDLSSPFYINRCPRIRLDTSCYIILSTGRAAIHVICKLWSGIETKLPLPSSGSSPCFTCIIILNPILLALLGNDVSDYNFQDVHGGYKLQLVLGARSMSVALAYECTYPSSPGHQSGGQASKCRRQGLEAEGSPHGVFVQYLKYVFL